MNMHLLFAVVSLVAQVVGLLACGFMVYDIVTLPESLVEQAAGDAALSRQIILDTAISYAPWIIPGIVGAIAMRVLILRGRVPGTDNEDD